jgi:hypothetical protein
MTQYNKAAGLAWIDANIHSLVGKNIRQYIKREVSNAPGTNALGLSADRAPTTGKVIHMEEGFNILKVDLKTFAVVDPAILSAPLELDSTVKITTYQRRYFNGKTFSEPVVGQPGADGISCRTYRIGQVSSQIPTPEPKSGYMKDMLVLLNSGKLPDGTRVISNMLVDCKATNIMTVDPDYDNDPDARGNPEVHFDCDTGKFVGHVVVGIDIGLDEYFVKLQQRNLAAVLEDIDTHEGVGFMELAEVLERCLCDGSWKIAKVEVIKAAPKQKLLKKAA